MNVAALIRSRRFFCILQTTKSVDMETIRTLLEKQLLQVNTYTLTIGNMVSVLAVFLVTVVILQLIKRILFRKKVLDRYERGSMYSLFQIIKYFLWIVSFLFMMQSVGIRLNVILASSAALLVGVGLGLQHSFNNFVSGIILLFEGSIKVGDVLELDGDVVEMLRIGLRTSTARNRDYIDIIIPNSIITSNKVVNWSHQSEKTRFRIRVGVAYGSDVALVLAVLRSCAQSHPKVKYKDAVRVRFLDFGNSSLEFELLFFSDDIFRVENIKSELREIIYQKFRENGIQIPFPQVDVHVKSNESGILKP